jgi:hypothetical protein
MLVPVKTKQEANQKEHNSFHIPVIRINFSVSLLVMDGGTVPKEIFCTLRKYGKA